MSIFLLEHHPLTSEMISMIIHRIQPELKVSVAKSFKQLLGLVEKNEPPAFVLIEPQSTGCLGGLSISHVAKLLPDSKIVIITDSTLHAPTNDYTEYGAQHIIEKTADLKTIALELKKIISPKDIKTELAIDQFEIKRLSRRHRQLIDLLEQGLSNKEIALHLNLSENTIKIHFHRLYKILNVNSRLQALRIAKQNGWISRDNYLIS